jgi:hypothetical protein
VRIEVSTHAVTRWRERVNASASYEGAVAAVRELTMTGRIDRTFPDGRHASSGQYFVSVDGVDAVAIVRQAIEDPNTLIVLSILTREMLTRAVVSHRKSASHRHRERTGMQHERGRKRRPDPGADPCETFDASLQWGDA